MDQCSKCGKAIPDETRFCPFCGAATALGEQLTQQAQAVQQEVNQQTQAVQQEVTQQAQAVQQEVNQQAQAVQQEVTQQAQAVQQEVTQQAQAVQQEVTEQAQAVQQEVNQQTQVFQPLTQPTAQPYTQPTAQPYTQPTQPQYTQPAQPTAQPYTQSSQPTAQPYTQPQYTQPQNTQQYVPQQNSQSGAAQQNANVNRASGAGNAAAASFSEYFKFSAPTPTPEEAQDASERKVMGILAYLGPLCFIPMFAAKNSKFARFHANNGLLLFIGEAAISLLQLINGLIFPLKFNLISGWQRSGFYTFFSLIYWLINIGLGVLAVFGIIHAAKGQKKDLPLVGNIKILK